MRTRRGFCYPRVVGGGGGDVYMSSEKTVVVKRRRDSAGDHMPCRKRNRKSPEIAGKCDLFDALPDDLVISILCKLSSSAGCPSDFINVLITYVTLRLLLSSCLIFIRRLVIDSGLSTGITIGTVVVSFIAKLTSFRQRLGFFFFLIFWKLQILILAVWFLNLT
jgi:hypothetical protein